MLRLAMTLCLVISLCLVSACDPYPWPEAPPGGPIVDGPYKNCLHANGYGPAETETELEVNTRALDVCDGVPLER